VNKAKTAWRDQASERRSETSC